MQFKSICKVRILHISIRVEEAPLTRMGSDTNLSAKTPARTAETEEFKTQSDRRRRLPCLPELIYCEPAITDI